MIGWRDSAYSPREKAAFSKQAFFDKQKKVRVQSAGPAQGEATLRKAELSNMNEKEQR